MHCRSVFLLVGLLSLSFLSRQLTAAEPAAPWRLAVTDIEINAADLDPVVAGSLSAVLAAELALRGAGRFEVISRNDLRNLVGQQAQAQSLGCSEPKCALDIGAIAAADKVVTASVGKLGDEWVFTLQLIEVATGLVVSRQAVSWKGPPSGLVELVRPYVARLMDGPQAETYSGALEILAPEKEAEVHLDDKSLGATPLGRLDALPIGRHRVRVSKDGFLPFETDVVVNRNETTLLPIDLVDEASLQPWYYKWWVWAGAGALLAGGVSLALLLQPEPTTSLTIETTLP